MGPPVRATRDAEQCIFRQMRLHQAVVADGSTRLETGNSLRQIMSRP
jgi:hypothetical protein